MLVLNGKKIPNNNNNKYLKWKKISARESSYQMMLMS